MADEQTVKDQELEWLKEQSGLSDADLKAYESVLGDAKFRTMLIKVKAANDQATADKTTAEAERLALEKRLNDEIYPEVRKVAQDSVRAQGELARAKAELEAARSYGIVPGSVEGAVAAAEPPRAPGSPDPTAISRDEFGKFQSNVRSDAVRGIAMLNDISAEHFLLTGKPLANSQELIDELTRERTLGHNDVDLRKVWERKFDIAKLRTEKAQAEKQKELDAYAETKVKEFREKHGDNPNTRVARESRFSQYDPSGSQSDQKPWQRDHQKRAANGPWREKAAKSLEKALVH